MYNDLIDETTRELPEVQLPVVVYFHCDTEDQAELRNRVNQIRHIIQEALADEDNDLRGFTYPEVRLDPPRESTSGGFVGRVLDI